MQLIRAIFIGFCFSLSWFHLNTAYADRLITEPFTVSGSSQAHTLSAHNFGQIATSNEKATYKLYTINYSELKRQLSIYKKIYIGGQLLHGGLMLKARPKFID